MFSKRLKKFAGALGTLAAGILWAAAPALAAGLQEQNPDQLTDKIIELVNKVGVPVGGALLFLSVCVAAIELIMARGRPEERARVMSGLLYIAIGGIILGGALFFAGVFFGIGKSVFGG
ncbi:hypothetical protein G7K71_18640 [Desulfofundulus sp. TPOSR]|uniref:hypothetical protein n=1 Tax=Desulfofundulus sp. TPOSR TaxID=2714340 RepID=UPI00140D2C09|nr:hypothetical protein [Desulfofundulus sp. TPOSR]NHM28943.1 hypothetical protein [Desulfofundulus sp. TPOSR]